MIEENDTKKGYSVSIYAHTRNFAGHVWMSLNDSQGRQIFYGVTSSEKSQNTNSQDYTIERSLEKLNVFVHKLAGDRKIKFAPILKRTDHEFAATIPLEPEQYESIYKETQQLSHNGKYYQLFGLGANHENCVTVIEKLLFNAGIDLNYYLPPTTWVETIKSPCSLIMRGSKPTEKIDVSFNEHSHSKTALSWVTEKVNAAETGLRDFLRQ